jgi:Ca2+-binding RTX toxin-like protein
MTLPVTLFDTSNNPIGSFSTIQAAVNAAANGDTIQVAPGTYQEQVTVNGLTNLTIEGTGADPSQTVILSPDYTSLVSNIQNPGENHTFTDALVGAENGASVTVSNLTVNGNNQGVIYALGANGGGDLIGIEGVNSSLSVSNVHVTGTEDVESGVLQGGQGNAGIIVNDTNSSTQTFTISGSTVDNFQRDGIRMEGAGLTANVNNNTVTGVGANPTNLSQNLIELELGATGSITQNQVTGVSDANFGSNGVIIFQSGSGVTVSNNTVTGLAGNVNSAGIYFLGVDAPTAEGNTITDQGFALADDGSFGAFNTALVQDNNTYTGNALNYFFFPDPTSTNAWTVTGTGGPDDLEGSTNNDVFTVMGGAPNGNTFVGNGGVDTVQGYGAGYHVAIQTNQWVVTNGAVTDRLTGIERVVINGQTYDLVDNQGQDVGGFQTLQSAVNAAQPGDIVVTDIGSASVTVGVDNLTFEPLQAATGITLTLASTGVHTIMLADYAPGQGVPVTVHGNDLGDTFQGNDGGDTFTGGAGNDTISGGAGVDTLSGGAGANVFRSTALDLNGDTITDLEHGDEIVITDADPAHFSFHFSGTTLSFDPNTAASATFDTVTLANAPTLPFSVTADPVSGVDLRLRALHPNDFNGDGISDLLWRSQQTKVATGEVDTWLINNGQMTGGAALSTLSTAWQFAGTGDFTGNGTSDVLWQNVPSGEVDTWLITNGQLTGGSAIGHASSVWQPLGTGDFNADGTSDILWRNTSTGEVDTWLMNNGQMTGGAALGTVSSAWQFAGIGDFNNDGTSDVLWHNTTTGEVDTWLISNDQVNGGTAIGHASSVWQSLGTGDFNGDGTSDILWRNTSTGEVDTWLMTNGQMTGGTALGTMSSAWQLAGIGDLTGNGTSDVVWRNTTTGQVETWLIANDHVTGGSVIGTVSSIWQPQVIHTS